MMNRLLPLVFLILASCGGPQRAAPPEMTPLGQARSMEIINEIIAEQQYGETEQNLSARLSNGATVNIDTLAISMGAGFVWLNEQDRHNQSGVIPEPAAASQIYALLANLDRDNRQVHVMIMHDRDFSYIPNPRADERQPEDRTVRDVEARLRRDARDFLHEIVNLHGGQNN